MMFVIYDANSFSLSIRIIYSKREKKIVYMFLLWFFVFMAIE